jgi:hypothetical protein
MEFFNWVQDSGFATWLREADALYSYDLFLVSHAIGMAMVVGLSVAVALRILGVAPGLPLGPMKHFFPFMFAGFWLNLLSGIVLSSRTAGGHEPGLLHQDDRRPARRPLHTPDQRQVFGNPGVWRQGPY